MSSENYRSNSPHDSRGNRSGQSPTPHGNDRRGSFQPRSGNTQQPYGSPTYPRGYNRQYNSYNYSTPQRPIQQPHGSSTYPQEYGRRCDNYNYHTPQLPMQQPRGLSMYPQEHNRRCNNYNYDASQRSISNPHSPGHYGSSFGNHGPQGQHRTIHTEDSPSSHYYYGPRGQDQDQGLNWRKHLTPQGKIDVDNHENALKRGREKSANHRRRKKEEEAHDTSLVDKSLSAVREMKEVAMDNNKVAKESLATVSDMTAANKEVAMDNNKVAIDNNKVIKETVDKSLSTISEMKEVSKHAIDKVAAAHSPSIGKKRKHQISVDEVEIDSHKQARGTEQDINSGMVRFANQHMTLPTALIVREMMTMMSYRVTQKEISTSDPVVIGDMQRFTDQRHTLHDMVHLKRELSKEEKEEAYQIGCSIVDQTLPEGPSASAIKNEISRVLDMTYQERHELYVNRNKGKKNSGSKSLLDEKIELEAKVEGLGKDVRRKDEKIQQLLEYRVKDGQNHSAELLELTERLKSERDELTERLKSERDEVVSLYKDKVASLEAKVAKLEAEKSQAREAQCW